MTPERSRNGLMFGAVCVAAGVVYLVLGLVRREITFGVVGLAIMVTYAAVLLALRRRSEPAALLSGFGSDERQQQVMLRASAATGQLLVVVLLGGFVVSMAIGATSQAVFSGLCAVAGVGFIASTIWFSRRG